MFSSILKTLAPELRLYPDNVDCHIIAHPDSAWADPSRLDEIGVDEPDYFYEGISMRIISFNKSSITLIEAASLYEEAMERYAAGETQASCSTPIMPVSIRGDITTHFRQVCFEYKTLYEQTRSMLSHLFYVADNVRSWQKWKEALEFYSALPSWTIIKQTIDILDIMHETGASRLMFEIRNAEEHGYSLLNFGKFLPNKSNPSDPLFAYLFTIEALWSIYSEALKTLAKAVRALQQVLDTVPTIEVSDYYFNHNGDENALLINGNMRPYKRDDNVKKVLAFYFTEDQIEELYSNMEYTPDIRSGKPPIYVKKLG